MIKVEHIDKNCFRNVPDVVFFLGATPEVEFSPSSITGDIMAVYNLSKVLMRTAWEKNIQIYYIYESNSKKPRIDCEALSGFISTAMLENSNHVWTVIGCYDKKASVTTHQILMQEWLSSVARPSRESVKANIFQSTTFCHVRYEDFLRKTQQRRQATVDLLPQNIFQTQKTYIVAGGLGLVGEELCTELAKQYQPNLVILSRSEYSGKRKQQCQKLEALGANVCYYAVDITNNSDLSQTFAQIKDKFQQIDGVLHLANEVKGGLIAMSDWNFFQDTARIKTKSSAYIDQLTANEPLDFFILFSSIASFGIRGSAGYSYACAYQNRFAEHRKQLQQQGLRSGNSISVCWGPWISDPIHAKADPQRREKICADGFDFITIDCALPILSTLCSQRSAIAAWAVRDVSKVKKYMDVADEECVTTEIPLADSIWNEQIIVWENQVQKGIPIANDELAMLMAKMDEIKKLSPTTIHRIYQLLYPENANEELGAMNTSVKERTLSQKQADSLDIESEKQALPIQPEQAKSTSSADRETTLDVKEIIKTSASELLNIEDIDENESFQNYGMDSVFGVQLAIRLEKQIGQEILPQWLIDFPTVKKLSQYIIQQQSS